MRSIRRINIALVLTLLCVASVSAGYSRKSVGTASAPFLKLPPAAREWGMGKIGTAFSQGTSSLYWNPAGLGEDPKGSLSFSRSEYIENTNHTSLAFVMPLRRRWGVGVSVVTFDAGSFSEINDIGENIGTLHPQDMAVTAGLGIPLGPLRFGGNVKYIASKIRERASTWSTDIGLRATIRPAKLTTALSVQNLGGHLQFSREEEVLPVTVRFGLSRLFINRFLFGLEGQAIRDEGVSFGTGGEARFDLTRQMRGFLRLGFHQDLARDKTGFSGATLGGGLSFGGFTLDYALAPMEDLGLVQYITLALRMK